METLINRLLVLMCCFFDIGKMLCSDHPTSTKSQYSSRYQQYLGRYQIGATSQYGEYYIGNYKMPYWFNAWHNYSADDIKMMGQSARNGYCLRRREPVRTIPSAYVPVTADQEHHAHNVSSSAHSGVQNTTADSHVSSPRSDSSCNEDITRAIHNLHIPAEYQRYYHLLRPVVYEMQSQSDIIAAFRCVASERNASQPHTNYLLSLNTVQHTELDNIMLPYGCHLAWSHAALCDCAQNGLDPHALQDNASTLVQDVYHVHAIIQNCPFRVLPSRTRLHDDSQSSVLTYAACVIDDVISAMHIFPIDHIYASLMHRVMCGDIPRQLIIDSFARVAHKQAQASASNVSAHLTQAQLNAYRYVKNMPHSNRLQSSHISPQLYLSFTDTHK